MDPRAGSKDIVPYLRPYDIEVEMVEMDFGDCTFYGNGPDGTVSVSIEMKSVADVVNSMRSGRLAGHQIPGLLKDYDHVVLLVEGIFRCGNQGELEVLKGREWVAVRSGSRPVLYRELSNFFVSLEFICGVVVQRCASPQETAAYIVGLYSWWQKEWEKHDLTKTIYKPDVSRPQRRAGFSRAEPGPVELVASILPGVSMKAWEFGKKFKTVEELVGASEKELREVDGIGAKGAKRIWQWLR